MKEIECLYFTEIENYETKSLTVIEKELFKEMKKRNIKVDTFTISHTTKFQHNKDIDFIISVLDRHIKYPMLAKKKLKGNNRIHHVLHNINASILLFKPKNCTVIVTCHDIHSSLPLKGMEYKLHKGGVLRNFFKKISNRILKKADFIISVSNNTKNDLIRYFKIPEEKIHVIYNGINHKVFRPRDKNRARIELGLPSKKHIVFSVASDEPRKNIETLIEAVSYVSKDIPDLLLVHVGALSSESKELIKTLEIENIVENFESVSEKTLSSFYNIADVFVFPSFYEGFGMPPLEAMASGCPVITTNRSSLPEVVGNAAIIVEPKDISGLADKIKKVLLNKTSARRLITDGIAQAKKFSWERNVSKTVILYRKILSEKFNIKN